MGKKEKEAYLQFNTDIKLEEKNWIPCLSSALEYEVDKVQI